MHCTQEMNYIYMPLLTLFLLCKAQSGQADEVNRFKDMFSWLVSSSGIFILSFTNICVVCCATPCVDKAHMSISFCKKHIMPKKISSSS